MHCWLRLILVCCFAVLILANDQLSADGPAIAERPDILNRYSRAILSRYGKRSALPRVTDPDNGLLLCRSVNGEFICKPYNEEARK